MPVPIAIDEDVEELGAEELLAPPVAIMEEPLPETETPPLPAPDNDRVADLEAELQRVRGVLQDVAQQLADLSERVRQLT